MDFFKDEEHTFIEKKIEWVEVSIDCGKCNNGKIISTGGATLLSSPPQHPHKCENCGFETYIIGTTFPKVEYRVKGDG